MPPQQRKPHNPSPRPDRIPSLFAAIVIGAFLALAGFRLLTRPEIDRPIPEQHPHALLIDINTAGEAELSALPRIGPALAKRITEDRSVSGPYPTLDDLDRVPGIGPRTIEAIRPYAIAR